MKGNNPFLTKSKEILESTHNHEQHIEQLKNEIEEKDKIIADKNKQIEEKDNNGVESLQIYDEIPESLAEIETQIITLKDKMWEVAWYLGKRFIVIRDKFLKELGYSNIADYALDKFSLGKDTTYRFISITEKFDKIAVLRHGSKLYPLSKIKDSER